MNIRKFYRNPQIKYINIFMSIFLIFGLTVIVISNRYICSRMKTAMINRDAVIMAHILEKDEAKEEGIVKYFVKNSDDYDIERAKNVLKTYGYDENSSNESNEIINELSAVINIIYICIFILFFILVYVMYIFILKKTFNKIDEIVTKVSFIGNGEYTKIDSEYQEGEMARLVSTINFMGDRVNNSILMLKNEKENLKDFLSDISHQLKTPLAALIMFNDILKDSEDMDYKERMDFLEKCDEQLGRMEWLIMNLLKVARIEAGVIKLQMMPQKIEDAIISAVKPLKQMCSKKNQKLTVEGDTDSIVYHDSGWIAEAVSNIVKNAIEHTQNGGNININVSRGPLITKIYIKDNGCGIPKEMQKNIFKRFYKGQNSVNPKSIGIGLSLSKSIIEKHKGDIRLRSKEGEGSTFIISLYNDKI